MIKHKMLHIPNPQSWPDCDEAIHNYIIGFVDLLVRNLKSRLVGVYLHGSLAMGSYFPPKSDMDFIIVTDNKLDTALAKSLNFSIAEYAKPRPTVGSIECSVITMQTAKETPEQMPYELHYSESCLNDATTYGQEKFDSDLPAHLMCIKRRGICLYGMAIDDVFGDVNWHNFLLSVMDDFNWIIEDENICESPYYGVLNICRVLQIISENNKKYLSKYEGAIWGMENLSEAHVPLIQKALEIYASNKPIDERERKTSGAIWDKTALLLFRDYAREKGLSEARI
jgi:streptomycin 3"-adenylyltransferase